MTTTYIISRSDLKAKKLKAATKKTSGTKPTQRETAALVRVLKKMKNN